MNYQAINSFLKVLDKNKKRISPQQYNTLKGQAVKGEIECAEKGLSKLLRY
jgi:hypothetical protein